MRLFKSLLLTLLVVGTLNSCKKDGSTATDLPVVITGNPVVSETEIILSGEVTFTDGENSTKRGVCWSENPNPTTNDEFYMDSVTGKGSYSVNVISQIKPNTNYYVRAFAENSAGKAYGNVVNLTYKAATELPQVTTANVKMSDTEIILSGEVTFTDGENSTKRGVCWSENPNPTTNDEFYMDSATGMGAFSVDVLSQLKPRTKYYVRAFAENSVGKAYGNVVDFTTGYLNPNDAVKNSRGCVECDKYEVGDTFTLGGVDYVVADRDMLDKALDKGEDLTKFCISKVDNLRGFFYGYDHMSFNQDISSWDVSNVTDMKGMFSTGGGIAFNQDIGNWDVSNVTDMEDMFVGANDFNQDIGNWDVSNVTSMRMMFVWCFAFNQDIGNWDVSNVTNMEQMFLSTKAFNQDLTNWCVSNFTTIPSGFSNNSALTPENHPVWGTCP